MERRRDWPRGEAEGLEAPRAVEEAVRGRERVEKRRERRNT